MKLHLVVCAAALLAASLFTTLRAQETGADTELGAPFAAFLAAHRYDDARQAALMRLRAQPGDAKACLALARAVAGLDVPSARNAAVPLLQNCTQQAPKSAMAHYALGLTLSEQMLEKGSGGGVSALSALATAPQMREALRTALDLEPGHFAARSLLVLFYGASPAMVGGGMDKANALVGEAASSHPEQARVLRAQIAMLQKRWLDAERELTATKPAQASTQRAAVRQGLQQAWLALAYHYAKEGEAARAKPIFERIATELPGHAEPLHGLGRALHELGEFDAAVAAYQEAAKLQGAARQPSDYRIGISWQAKAAGADGAAASQATQAAIDAFERYLNVPPNRHLRKSTYEDARRRLAALRAV